MQIAVLSDIHDNIWNLEKVINQIKNHVGAVIFCGDFCAPFVASYFANLGTSVYASLGNNDQDQLGILKWGGKTFHLTALWEEYGKAKFDGKKIAFCHYPKLGELLAKTGEFDAVFYGHTHQTKNEKYTKTLLLNPGAVCGINPRAILGIGNEKPGIPSYGLYDTKTNSAKIIQIK